MLLELCAINKVCTSACIMLLLLVDIIPSECAINANLYFMLIAG